MIEISNQFRGDGYLIVATEYDTTNIICRRGHIYSDSDTLVAALDNGTRAECQALRKLGVVVADGDFGELSVRFPLYRFRAAARILRPRQRDLSRVA